MSRTPSMPAKIILKSTTSQTLSDRFTELAKEKIKSPPQVNITGIRNNQAQIAQASMKNRRLAAQLARRPGLQNIMGQVKTPGNLKNRLGTPNRVQGGNLQGRLGSPRGKNVQTGNQPANLRGFGRGGYKSATRGRRGFGRGGSVRGGAARGGAVRGGFVRGGSTRGGAVRGGSTRGGSVRGRVGNSGIRGGRGASQQRGSGGQGFRGRGRGGRGRGRGRGARGGSFSNVTREALDSDIDTYMSSTGRDLNTELDEYMKQVGDD